MTPYLPLTYLTHLKLNASKQAVFLPAHLIRRWLIGALFAVSSLAYSAPMSHVEVIGSDKLTFLLTFKTAPRVDELVINALKVTQQSAVNIDWLSSALFDVSTPYHKKQQVLVALEHQEALADEHHKEQWRQLQAELRKRSFARRMFTPLDPDITRITPNQNPRLSGQWLLKLHSWPTTVSVLGNVKLSDQITWQPRTDARYYLNKLGLVDKDTSQVWVIQSDGHASLHNIAYWNYQFQNIAPGATIYVPLPNKKTTLYPQLSDVNHAVVDLLRNQQP